MISGFSTHCKVSDNCLEACHYAVWHNSREATLKNANDFINRRRLFNFWKNEKLVSVLSAWNFLKLLSLNLTFIFHLLMCNFAIVSHFCHMCLKYATRNNETIKNDSESTDFRNHTRKINAKKTKSKVTGLIMQILCDINLF